jgi:hypothetical protein
MTELHAVCISESFNDARQEEGNSIYSAICAEVDEDHDVELGVLECFPNVLRLESDFLVGIISCESHNADFPLTTCKALRNVGILIVNKV